MSPDSSERRDKRTEIDRAVIESALAGMSDAELIDLRTTAHRLKHLPFTRLVEALFSQAASRTEGGREDGDSNREYNFAGEESEHSASEFVRELFRMIERALAAKKHLQ